MTMSLNYKKSRLIESMGYNHVLPTFYGKTPQNIKLTEAQFRRLVEGYMESEDEELSEMNFGDGATLPAGVDFQTDDFDPAPEDSVDEGCGSNIQSELESNLLEFDELGMFNPGDGADDESYDGHHFKHDVIGVYDDNLDKKSREGEIYEDSGAEESYHYDEDLHQDSEELHNLKKHGADKKHIDRLLDDMMYDEKRGVGKDDKWRDIKGTHFYHDK